MSTRRSHRISIAAVAPVLASSGCAERRLIAGPANPPSSVSWVVVWLAGALVALVVGVLLTLPVWRERRGARVAATVLTLQTGAIATVGAVLATVAARTWQLVDRSVDAPPAAALLRLSSVDGDSSYLALMVLVIGLLTLLLVSLSAGTARLAASDDVTGRLMAAALLAVEVGVCGYLGLRLALGGHGLPFVGGALAFPVLAAALLSSWPRRTEG